MDYSSVVSRKLVHDMGKTRIRSLPCSTYKNELYLGRLKITYERHTSIRRKCTIFCDIMAKESLRCQIMKAIKGITDGLVMPKLKITDAINKVNRQVIVWRLTEW